MQEYQLSQSLHPQKYRTPALDLDGISQMSSQARKQHTKPHGRELRDSRGDREGSGSPHPQTHLHVEKHGENVKQYKAQGENWTPQLELGAEGRQGVLEGASEVFCKCHRLVSGGCACSRGSSRSRSLSWQIRTDRGRAGPRHSGDLLRAFFQMLSTRGYFLFQWESSWGWGEQGWKCVMRSPHKAICVHSEPGSSWGRKDGHQGAARVKAVSF